MMKKMVEELDKDALDALRRFIKKNGIKYATMKVELEIQDGIVYLVRVNIGDITIKLKANDNL